MDADERTTGLHASGYVSRAQQLWYGVAAPVYDAFVRWCFVPLGGERRVREWILAVEHAAMEPGISRTMRSLWWVYWLPWNPERRTTLDLQRRGLANEMEEAGLTVLHRRVTRPRWIEAVLAAPAAHAP